MDYRKLFPNFAECKLCIKLEKDGDFASLQDDPSGRSFWVGLLLISAATLAVAVVLAVSVRWADSLKVFCAFFGALTLMSACGSFVRPVHSVFWMHDGKKLALHIHRKNPRKQLVESGICRWVAWDAKPPQPPYIRGSIVRIPSSALFLWFHPHWTSCAVHTPPDAIPSLVRIKLDGSLRGVMLTSPGPGGWLSYGPVSAHVALDILHTQSCLQSMIAEWRRAVRERDKFIAGVVWIAKWLADSHDRRKSRVGKSAGLLLLELLQAARDDARLTADDIGNVLEQRFAERERARREEEAVATEPAGAV